MATGPEYEEAKARFERAAEDVGQILVPVRQANGRDVLTGGRLTSDIDAFIETTGSELNKVGDELLALAQVCAQRAEEYRQAVADAAAFSQDLEAYRRAKADYDARLLASADGSVKPGRAPIPPVKPEQPPSYLTFFGGL